MAQKQKANGQTIVTLSDKFRYLLTADKVVLQFFDDAGTVVTDSWLDMLAVNLDDSTNEVSYSTLYTKTQIDAKVSDLATNDQLPQYYMKEAADVAFAPYSHLITLDNTTQNINSDLVAIQ